MKIFDADVTGSLHVSGSSNLQGDVSVTGSLNVSGDNKFGDQLSDNHNFTGSVNISGSATIIGNFTASQLHGTASYAVTSSYSLDSDKLDGKDSSVFATTGSNVFKGDQTITGSLTVTGSNTFIGTQTVTGALYTSGSNQLVGDTTLSGSITISGSFPPTSPSASLKIYGNTEQTGYVKFLPVVTTLDTSISGSYVFVSGSTDDLYFSQNSAGYANVTRLRWLEGNLYTGILKGGVLSSTPGSTTFNVSAGDGIIVTINASLTQDPYPTVKPVSWPAQTNVPIINSGSAKITYVGIDNTGGIVQQVNAWGSTNIDQWDQQINLGVVLHLSGSVSTGVFNSQQTSYAQPQKTDDFLRAFGPLKVSGHVLSPSGSAPTLSLKKTGGNAYKDGANYVVNPNHPSTIIEGDVNTSKIYRYYISGSSPVIDTGVGNAGYTTIDNTHYVNTTTGTLSSVGNGWWSIQRVFWVPNSPTNAFIVYYGNARYSTLLNAVNAKDSESFTEAPNTALNAIFLGYIIIEGGNNRDLLDPSQTTIIPGGLFRSVGGVGSSGTPSVSTALSGLSDVELNSLSQGDLLMYNGGDWINTKRLPGNYTITGSLTTTQGFSGSLDYSYLINKPTLVSGSSQITYSGLTGIPSGIVSGSSQISSLGFITGYTETDTLDSVTDRNAVTTNTIEVGGLTSNGDIQFGPVPDNNVNYSIKSGGQIIIHSNNQGTADQYFSNLVLKAGDGSTQSIFNVGGSNASTPNQGLWYTFGGSEYFRINPSGTVKLNHYTTNGFVKFINSDGTLTVDTNTYLTAHPSVSAASSSNNSGRTYIQDILLDSFGHITGITTATETVTDTNNFTTGATFNTGNGEITFTKNDGTTYTVDLDGRYGSSSSDYYTTGATFNTSDGVVTFTRNDGGTYTVDLDGRFLTAHPSVSAASSSDNSGRTYIQDILLDSFGHITGITTATETVVDTYTTGATTNGTTGLITFTKNDGGTYTTSISGYVTTQITNLIDSAPSTLDTLNELAAALGDDPNFATSIATSIGNKVSKSGDTMTGNLSIFKNNTTLTLGQINVSTGFTTIEMYAGGGGAFNGYAIRYNKDTSFDRLEFVDGGGIATVYFENGGFVNANQFRKIGGTSSQFLKADGSVDSSTYLTAHPSVSAASSSNNSGRTYIQDILLDSFGHITGITTATETVTDTNTFITGATFNTSDGVVTITKNDGNTVTVDLDGRYQLSGSYLTGYTETDTLATVTARGNTTNQAITVSGVTSYNDVVISGGTLTVYESVSGATVFAVDGTNGRLFAVTDDLSNSLFSVSTISGLPVIEAFADYHIVMGRFNQNDFYLGTTGEIGMGSLPVSGYKLAVTGNVRATSFVKSGGTSSQFLKADGSVDSNTYLTAHPSVSAASSSNNSGRTYIQDILLDSYGHITGITTASETVTDTNNYTTGVTFNTGDGVLTFTRNDGNTYTVDLDGRYGSSSSDFYTTGATFNTSNGVITYTRNDGGTYTVDIDGRFLTSYSEISTLEDVVQRGNTSTISITAASFITQGGNSGQFVKGDGTLDSNTYLTAHPSVSAASSSNNSGRTYIQDILLDSFGHITGITTASETVTDTNYYVTGATFNTGNGVVTLTRNDGNTITVDLDGKYLDSSSYTASDVLSKLLTVDGASSGLDADLLDGQHGSYYYPASNPSGYISSYLNYYTTGATFNTGNGIITFTRNDGNTYTVDIDGKYAESSHTHDDRYLPYAKTNDVNRAVGWYTIAVNPGNRAVGRFILRDTSSGNHQSVVFYATHHYGNYSDITVLINSRYSGNPFRTLRIVDGSTYDGALLQVYIDDASCQVQAWMLENIQASGWIIKDWVADGVNPGDVNNFPAMTEVPAQVDLDQAPQGGIITTGPIFGGGDTTQYEYLNTNNYSTTTDTRYYTETEIGNFFGGSTSITGYNKSNWDTAFGWGNHGTQGYATTGYVQTQITNLIDGAPAALDTLNELAAALGDDPNFATTFAGAIGAKLPLSGGTMTGNIAFGATSNLGLTWGLNTDAAFIKFISTSNAAGGSYLEIGTQDDSDEEIKFTQSGNVRFYLATDGFLRNGAGYKYVFENGTWGINISGNAATVTNGVYDNGSYSNPSWITALAGSKITGNISGNAYNITQYTINQDLGTGNSVSFNAVTSPVYYTTASSTRNKIILWGTDTNYVIGMESAVVFGGLNDYAMTFQMNNEDDRGFWWGDATHSTSQGAMALTTNGYLTVARGVRVGYGESDTTTPSVPLQVYGSGSLVFDVQGSQGQLFSVTDSLSGSLFSVNDISGLPILEVFSDDKLVAGSFGTNAFVVSGTTTTVSGSLAVSGSATVNGGTVWHSGNDGSGSGLDADTLDGLHASSFLTAHPSVSAAGSSNNSGRTYIQDILLDSFGHITGITTATETVVDTDTNYYVTGATFNTSDGVVTLTRNDGGTITVDLDGRYGSSSSDYYTTGATFNTGNGIITFTRNDGGTYTVDIDGKYLDSSSYTASDVLSKLLTVDGSGSGLDADTLDGYHASSFLTSYSETDTLNSVTTRGASTTNDITIGGLTVGGSLTYGTYTSASNYVLGADNILLKGNSGGVSGIFFESEKNGTNINHPSDFGFIQYHAYGVGGSSGESNRLVIGVSNDADDVIVLNPVSSNGLVVRVGAGTTEYTVYHAGNIPTWNQNTTGTASNITAYTINQSVGTSDSPTFAGLTSNGVGVFNSTNDTQISLRSTDSWSGIEFDDSGTPDYIWYNGGNQTFSIGGGGGNVSGKKLHVHGGVTIGSSYTSTSVTTNGLAVEGAISASNFSGSSSGTNTGDQTNISGNAGTATLASTVTINYNNDSNSTYQMLWGSGNSVYGTAGVYLNPSTDYVYATSFNASDWFRSSAATGWYNTTYEGGIYMTESTSVRVYNNKAFWIDGGNGNSVNDATLYVTATNNNDWLAQFNAYNSSKSEYGIYVNIAAGATYGYALRTDSSSFTYRVDGSGRVYAPIYYDINDTAYYLNPASTSNLATVKLNSTASGTEVFTIDGVNGRLFTITDDLSNSLFSVNTIAGVPVIEAFADNKVIMGRYNQNDLYISSTGEIGMGNISVSGYKLAVTGNLRATSFVKTGGSSSQFLMADGSVSTNPGWITSYTDTNYYVTGATFNTSNGIITMTRNDGGTITVDIDGKYYEASNPNGYTSNVGTVTSVSGTGTVNGLSLSGTVSSTGNITLGGSVSISVIDNVTDEERLFNNMGQNHTTQTDFNSITNFGARFVQGTTNGPGTGSSQFYGFSLGLGNDYAYSQYVLQLALPRDASDNYVTMRRREAGTWGSWYKIYAGYADTAGALTSMNISQFTNNSGYLTAHPSVSAAGSSNNSGRTYIQDILLDSFGHITGITTATETVVDTDTNYYVTSASFNTSNGIITLTRNDGGTVTVDIDGKYQDAGTYLGAITYNDNSNANYQLLWGSGNAVYGTAGVYVNPSSDYVYAGSFVSSGWFRSTGTTGWYSETYGGGIYMEDSTWVRVYNNKQFLVENLIQSNTAVYAPIFYDSADNNYYLNPNGTSNLKTVKVNSTVAGTDALTVDGVNGRLFTITDDMTSSIFSVNTISGLPVMEAFADYTVVMGRYGQNDLYISNVGLVGIGKIPSTYKVDINGNVMVRGGYAYYGEYGTWTGEANKIQWHSNNLYIQNTGGGEWLFRNSGGSNVVSITNAGILTAASLVKSGGSSSQFLMADGSVSTNPGWITSYTDTNYYVTGATFNTGNGIITLTRNDGGTITVDIDGKYAESSHTHDDRYFTETESDNRFQPLENQRVSTGNSPSFSQVFTTQIGINDSGIDCYMEIGDDNPTEDGIGYGGVFRFYGDKSVTLSHLYFGGAYVYNNFVVGGRITENSSIRYKKDIETLEGGLDKVLAMRGVTYVKKDTGVKEVGLIAEELAEILPEVVGFDTQGQPDSVSYSRLTAILVEAIKDLKKEIDELKGKK